MYLDGQLPYGPKSSNVGAPPIPTFDTPAPQNTFVVPGGGETVVSPSIANADGIVQYPVNEPRTAQFDPGRSTVSYGRCGDYAADGSLPTIADRSGAGAAAGLGNVCNSGPQALITNKVPSRPGAGALVVAGLAALLLFGGNR